MFRPSSIKPKVTNHNPRLTKRALDAGDCRSRLLSFEQIAVGARILAFFDLTYLGNCMII